MKEDMNDILIQIKTDHEVYCRKHLERYQYVCPDPLRFRKYAAGALMFCERYSRRCPDEQVPKKPVPFAQKKEYYIRELKYFCNRERSFAELYCTNKVALKLPKYFIHCLHYKHTCIDAFKRVIYTG
uniref:CX9C domain-containing protein n=1 Tax=Thelazia callipaeda TaxID=103827 RepID=A0A0N5CLB8_THECL